MGDFWYRFNSSLSLLKEPCRFDELKIDRAFIDGLLVITKFKQCCQYYQQLPASHQLELVVRGVEKPEGPDTWRLMGKWL